jgi:hypothetical protein
MAKFQMIDSTNPLTIAEVNADGDIKSFNQDPGWYLMAEEEEEVEVVKKVLVKTTQTKRV